MNKSSRKPRHPNAGGDIVQHRIANHDWGDDWVFDDPRFRLASGPNEVLLGFLAQMAHPVVQPDTGIATRIVADLNRLLASDGWMLKPYKHLSGPPVYEPARTDTGGMAAVSFAHQAATRIDTEYVSQQATRMEGAARRVDRVVGMMGAEHPVGRACPPPPTAPEAANRRSRES